MIGVEPTYVDTPLPSGGRARVWATDWWCVIEAHGRVTVAWRGMRSPLPGWLAAELAPALAEAGELA